VNEKLTPRQQQIIDLLLCGCQNKEIGKILGIAERTVKNECNKMYKRFGITSGIKRVKLAVLMYRKELEEK
jgi:DNA-binding NarL/FixJ family response regulator